MQCTTCGSPLADNAVTCPNCGTPVNQQQYFNQGQAYSQPLTKSQFLKHPNLKSCRTNINSSAIILYVCAIISLGAGILLTQDLFSLIDVVLLVGLALGIQLAKSRVCAIIVCVYAGFNTLYMILSTGRPGGYLILIAAIFAVVATFKFQKTWNEYQKTGILPPAK